MFGGTETVASAIEWTMADHDKPRRPRKASTATRRHRRPSPPSTRIRLTQSNIPQMHSERNSPSPPADSGAPPRNGSRNRTRGLSDSCQVSCLHQRIGDRSGREVLGGPDIFRPARFEIEGAADFKGGDFEFVPFGSGRRSCPGMQLVVYAVEMAVANLG
ncbi:hypothetical protein Csa_015358 [Cucumis sativus]|nr:hypothetical protein Csa_015358 [Cucumis sativus]